MGHTEKIAADGHFILIVTSGATAARRQAELPDWQQGSLLFFFLFFFNPFFFPWFPTLKLLIFWVA